jgi:plasmid stabilization system protein ParE/uncharacterized membrane protein
MEWIKKLGRWISEHVASFVAILVFLGLLIGGIVWIATQQARERDLTQQAQSLTAQAQLYQAQRDDARQKLDTANQELNAANRAADNLCAVVRLAVRNGSITQSEAATVSDKCSTPAPILTITDPPNSQSSSAPTPEPPVIIVTGTLDSSAIKGQVWIVTIIAGTDKYFPQGSWPDHYGPADVSPNGVWTSPSVYLGQPQDRGKKFDIIAVEANPAAANAFWDYLQRGTDPHVGFPGMTHLPQGVVELARVTVTRSQLPAPKRRLTCLFTRIREHLPRHMHRDPGRGPIGLPAYLRYSPPL